MPFSKSIYKIAFFSLLLSFNMSNAQEFIRLWPEEKMPNSKGIATPHVEARERITQVEIPAMYAFTPSKEENKGSAVLIFPPGGYQKLTYNLAGYQWAKWFNTMGMTAFVVIYRLPNSPDLIDAHLGPIQDAQRALKMVRNQAEMWGIEKNKIGVMGASAGGHLASTISTFQDDFSRIADSLDTISFRPDFQILISPVISMGKFTHRGSRDALLGHNPSSELIDKFSTEKQVSGNTPPTIIFQANDDATAKPQNSVLFYQALLENGVSTSLHIFPQGNHSIALRNNLGSTQLWPEITEAWLVEMGFL